ncbi:MAG: XRE family transcriptional regulator [Betaproteobacteria bacterium]|nr:XRE family transcriptional regulator [Betaproteobacteria bacterium]
MLIPSLSEIQGMTEELPNFKRKRHQVALATANPDQQPPCFSHFASLYQFRYEFKPVPPIGRQRSQRRLTLEMLSAKVGMSPQHLSEIESGKRDPRLSSIERMAEAMGMPVLIVPEAMAPTMPKKKPDPTPTQPSAPSPESSSLSFTIETFDDPEISQPTQYGRFSRHWQDEEALVVLIDKLEAGQLSHKQALMQALNMANAAGSHHALQPGNSELHCQPAVGTGPAG